MRFLDYKLGDKPLRILEDTILFKNERCIVNAFKDTLALPIEVNGEPSGYVFHGKGKLLIDSIIETCRGAVGKSTERDLEEPFLMLGGATELSDSMSPVDASDLSRLGYESAQALVKRADVVCERFFRKQSRHSRWNFNTENACLFAFVHDEDRLDLLISKKEKLLYIADGETYVFKGDKGVLTRHGEVIVSRKGKTVHLMNNNVFIERQE